MSKSLLAFVLFSILTINLASYTGLGRWENFGGTVYLFVLKPGPTIPVDINPTGLNADADRVWIAVSEAARVINEQNGVGLILSIRNRVSENVDTNAHSQYGRILVGASPNVPYGAIADTSPSGMNFDVGRDIYGNPVSFSNMRTLTSCGYRIKSSLAWCGVDGLPTGCTRDLWSVSVHELCHCVGLEHTSSGVMYMPGRGLGYEDKLQFKQYYLDFFRPPRLLTVLQ